MKRVIKYLMYLVFFLWLVSVCALDSPSWTPTIVCAVCTVILALYSWANNWFYDYNYEEDTDE